MAFNIRDQELWNGNVKRTIFSSPLPYIRKNGGRNGKQSRKWQYEVAGQLSRKGFGARLAFEIRHCEVHVRATEECDIYLSSRRSSLEQRKHSENECASVTVPA